MSVHLTAILVLCCLVAGCAPPTSGGILTNPSPKRSDGTTCTVGDKTLCMEQSSTDSSACPGFGKFSGHTRSIKLTSIPTGKRYAVLFEKIVTPVDGQTPIESASVGTFSELQSNAELGCDAVQKGTQTYFIQLKYACARELVGIDSSPSAGNFTCGTSDPAFDPNLLPAQPLALSEEPVRTILVQHDTRILSTLVKDATLNDTCQAKCEDTKSGACVRLRIPSKLMSGLVAPALPIDGAGTAQRTYGMGKFMTSLDVKSDPCQRGDLLFRTGIFENSGQACSVNWDASLLGKMTVGVPASLVGKLGGTASTLTLRFPDPNNALTVAFESKDLSTLNGAISVLQVTESAVYAQLATTCISVKGAEKQVASLQAEAFLVVAALKAEAVYSAALKALSVKVGL